MDSRRLSQREVDLHRAETKRKRQAAVEEQLKGAITALKKPNRGMAVKDYADSCDRRVLSSTSQGELFAAIAAVIWWLIDCLVRKPAGVISTRGVQVEATPKGGRTQNVAIDATPFALARQAALPLPPQSEMCIPSSAVRPPPVAVVPGGDNPLQDTPHRARRHNFGLAADETPCRRGSKMASMTLSVQRGMVENKGALLPSTPSAPRTTLPESSIPSKAKAPLGFQTPVKQIRLSPASASESVVKSMGVAKTPKAFNLSMEGVIGSKGGDRFNCSVNIKASSDPLEEEPSLYAQLGWDEVDELV